MKCLQDLQIHGDRMGGKTDGRNHFKKSRSGIVCHIEGIVSNGIDDIKIVLLGYKIIVSAVWSCSKGCTDSGGGNYLKGKGR